MRKLLRVVGVLVAVLLLVMLGVRQYHRQKRTAPNTDPVERADEQQPERSERAERPGPPIDPDAPRATLRVEVVTEPADRPCEWTVRVRVRDGDSTSRAGSGTGTETGTAEFEGLVPSRAHVTVSAPGFIDDRQALDLASGESVTQVVTLRALGVLAGRVDSPDGPVEGAHVFIAVTAQERGRLGFVGPENMDRLKPARTQTDEAGHFEFADVVPSDGYVVDVRHQAFAPVVLESVAVAPGERRELEVRLLAGAYLTGSIVDHRGRPLAGVTLDVLVPDPRLPLRAWKEDSSVVVRKDGSFRTAPLTAESRVLLRVTAVRDGVHLAHNLTLPSVAPGPTDLGVLRVRSHVVTFRLPDGVAPDGVAFLATGSRDPATGQIGATTAQLRFDADRTVRVAGLGPGRVNFSAWITEAPGGLVANGSYLDDGTERTVQLEGEPPDPPRGRVRVRARLRGGSTAHVLLVKDGNIENGRAAAADGVFDASVFLGRYDVYLIEDGAVGRAETTVTEDGRAEVDVSATSVGREVKLTVLDGGEPVPGAVIHVAGFVERSGGFGIAWAKADEHGEVTLRGIPDDAEGVRLAASHPSGDGRRYFVPRDKFGGATLDLRGRQVQ